MISFTLGFLHGLQSLRDARAPAWLTCLQEHNSSCATTCPLPHNPSVSPFISEMHFFTYLLICLLPLAAATLKQMNQSTRAPLPGYSFESRWAAHSAQCWTCLSPSQELIASSKQGFQLLLPSKTCQLGRVQPPICSQMKIHQSCCKDWRRSFPQ